MRVSQVTGPSSSNVPCSNTTPGAPPPSPIARSASLLPSGNGNPWAPGINNISWLDITRPARSRAYASTAPLPWPLQGSLPTWLGSALVRRDSHPLDNSSEFHEIMARSFLTSRAWSQPRLLFDRRRSPSPPALDAVG